SIRTPQQERINLQPGKEKKQLSTLLNQTSKEKEIDKLMALISLSFKKIYKPTNNNLRTSSNTSRANQDNSPRIHRNAGYEGQRSGTVAGARDTVGSSMKIYKPTNNNLCTSSNTSRVNQDNSPRIHRNAGYEGQRSGTVAGARDTVGSLMVKKSGIQCYNCKEYGHIARECQKPKRAKDAAYHREKMLLCKQEEAGIQLNAEQAD
nr:Gag-Pol polyprotein [Tanacetum cinerariifolium]